MIIKNCNLARHPDRPYSLDYIRLIMEDAYEIHGDRALSVGWTPAKYLCLILRLIIGMVGKKTPMVLKFGFQAKKGLRRPTGKPIKP